MSKADANAEINGMKEIALAATNQIARIDDADLDLVREYRWKLEQRGSKQYAVHYPDAHDPTNKLRMHRLILDAPADAVVDHIDGDGLNNQRANLRVCTQQENNRNRRKVEGCTSRFKGVSHAKGRKKCWRAQIRDGSKMTCIGYFSDEVEAARAYDEAARSLHAEFGWLNFPDAIVAQEPK
jgi:hypothetical protein